MPAVTLLLFAGLKDAAGTSCLTLAIPSESLTLREVWDAACRACPPLAPWTETVRFARNGEYAAATETVRPSDELAAIPPVSGG